MNQPSDSDRISALCSRCRDRKDLVNLDDSIQSAQSLLASQDEPSWPLRMARLTRDRLLAAQFAVDDLELLLGRPAPAKLADDDPQIQQARQVLSQYPFPRGQTGHCELDVSELFAVGIDGLRQRMDKLAVERPEAAEVYRSFEIALEGFSAYIEHAADASQACAQAGAPAWRVTELEQMAAACRHIAHKSPRTFNEAIQLLWLADTAVMRGDRAALVVPGHLDRTLWSYYQADRAAGRLSRERALMLLESLYLQINEFVADGLAMSVMIGGRDADGNDVSNELSALCMEAVRRTGLIYPTVGLCWHEGTPADLVELTIELIAQGYTTPAFFNDQTIQNGLAAMHVPPVQRCCYINSTCVEITPSGASGVWVASPYLNTPGLLLEEIAAQVESPAPAGDFKGFLTAYYERLGRAIDAGAAQRNWLRRRRFAHARKPLQSVLTRDCTARGLDIEQGGAIYNWVECSFVGLANTTDSLMVLHDVVWGPSAQITLAQLKQALDDDFRGAEPLRLRLFNGVPKYGNADPRVDGLMARTVSFCCRRCASQRMAPDDSPFVPGCFAWIMHDYLGRETGATPDGRKAGWAFADGCGPAQGREFAGPTAAILSTTSWDHSPMIGGLAYNMKFARSLFSSPAARGRLRDLVLTFLRRGGMETQINVVDAATLHEARQNPQQYRDLTVRIGGYSDYFVRLSPQMQEEVIRRTEFADL